MARCIPRSLALLWAILLVGIVLSTASAQAPRQLPGLVSWWPLNGDGSDAEDGNQGTLEGVVTVCDGVLGQALSFDGEARVWVEDSDNLDVPILTIDAWVRPTHEDGDKHMVVNKEEAAVIGFIQYEIAVAGSAGFIPEGHITFHLGGVSGLPDDDRGWVDAYGLVPLNVWSHLAVTYDGSVARAYINGVMTREIAGLSGSVQPGPGLLSIGARSCWAHDFRGAIDEVHLFNRALSAEEIAILAGGGPTGAFPTSWGEIKGLWR